MAGYAILICLAVFGVALWKTGWADRVVLSLGLNLQRGSSWLTSQEGAWVHLGSQLPYRDFLEGDQVVETEDGWLWAGLYTEGPSTDGLSGADWNVLYERLNRVLTGLPDGTSVQVLSSVSTNAREAASCYGRLRLACADGALRLLLSCRLRQIERDAARGLVCVPRTYVFVGRRHESMRQRLPVKGLWSASTFVDLEAQELNELRAEVLQAREYFRSAFESAGGAAWPLTAEQIFALVYARLNPERARRHPAPQLPPARPPGVQLYQPVRKVTAAEAGTADAKEIVHNFWVTGAGLFADSPRERLTFEPLEIKGDHLLLGDRPLMVISLQQLPTLVFAGLCEQLTRHPKMNFSFDVVTSFEIAERWEADDRLAKKATRLQINLEQARVPDQTEELTAEDIRQIRTDIRKGEAKLGQVGMAVVFSAPDVTELYRRYNQTLLALRSMEGLEGAIEKHLPVPQFVSTLPCAMHRDGRRRVCLSRDAVAMMPLTGGSRGPVRPAEATMVFERADGGLFFWNPHTPRFPSGMAVVVGGTGSGKSGLLNYTRTALAAAGYRLLSIDFGGSAARPCAALGGKFIDITDARRAYRLGLFDIRPHWGEAYERDELTPEGLPRDRLAEVEEMMEQLCLDPRGGREVGLNPRLSSYLRRAVRDTYATLVGDTPRLDDFISTLRLARSRDRELAEELAARLEIYAAEGSLGRFLNEAADVEEIPADCPYLVFDLRHARRDPRLMLVASLAVNAFIRRLLHSDRRVPKYVDVDEFNVVAENPLICQIINETMRTARKLNTLGSVATQSPGDFAAKAANPAAAGIRDNCEIFWLLRSSNPQLMAEVFQLRPGAARLLRELQSRTSEAWRDCVLLWPGGGCAYLRLRFGPVDGRLLLGAGHQVATLAGARAELSAAMNGSGNPPTRLLEALELDALNAPGTPLAKQELLDTTGTASPRREGEGL